jgi:hypothetical protein
VIHDRLSFRSPPWVLGPAVLVGAVVTPIAWAGGARFLAIMAAVLSATGLPTAVRRAFATTTLDPDGLTVRSVAGRRSIPWGGIFTLRVTRRHTSRQVLAELSNKETVALGGLRGSPWWHSSRFEADLARLNNWSGRYRPGAGPVQVDNSRNRGEAVVVAAALVLAVWIFERPDRWLPGDDAATLPAGCAYLEPATLERLRVAAATPPPTQSRDPNVAESASCQWVGAGGSVSLVVSRFHRDGLTSAAGVADRTYDDLVQAVPEPREEPDLGDEAVARRLAPGSDPGSSARVTVRRGNVIIIAVHTAPADPNLTTRTIDLTQEALDAVWRT